MAGQVSSASAIRSAPAVPACGQAMRMADWGSHSAGKRSLESDMETFCMHSCTQRCRQGYLGGSASADGGLGTDLVRGGLVRDRIDDAALLEIDHEARVRSEERSVGKEGVSTGSSRWSQDH